MRARPESDSQRWRNAPAAKLTKHCARRALSTRRTRGGKARERQVQPRAALRGLRQCNRPPVSLGYRTHDRETQASPSAVAIARLVGPLQAVQDALALSHIHTRPVVLTAG